ncbi:ribonuclease PH [Cutibacterium avidum]|uniref:Ribonuclease PH n=1 Tax=Cutibacterium avidum TaxID=33010 RepID=A0A3E2DMK2_9ACTN|nr:ribonuclease PH [Cutibacterium avidum]TMT54809.1 ribonuclease PH [Cutibacterium avidum]
MLKKLEKAAKARGLSFTMTELTRHTGVTIGTSRHTLGRHSEIDEKTAGKFFDEFADVLGGKGWWR